MHRLTFHNEWFFIQVANSAYFAVICLVNLGLAWVSPEPDLPLPSPEYAGDFKPSLPGAEQSVLHTLQNMYSALLESTYSDLLQSTYSALRQSMPE